jgi:hypothetical protein
MSLAPSAALPTITDWVGDSAEKRPREEQRLGVLHLLLLLCIQS